MSVNLLEKTELWIDGIILDHANLTEMAAVVAQVLGIAEQKVMVVDVREDHITFDVLEKELEEKNIAGKQEELLECLSHVPGVTLTGDALIHSNGILGLIAAPIDDVDGFVKKVSEMREDIVRNVTKRAIVFPTGFELEQGMICDTNSPYICEMLTEHGYKARIGEVIPDDERVMALRLAQAVEEGFGLIITTGGVGAEDKDHSVESILAIDPEAAVPYIVRFRQGTGRHVKDGVRIAAGQSGLSLLISLPGPHDEVELTMPVLLKLLEENADKETIASALAGVLAAKWERGKHSHPHGHGAAHL